MNVRLTTTYQFEKVHIVQSTTERSWTMCDVGANGTHNELAIFRLQGIICGKMLPPMAIPR